MDSKASIISSFNEEIKERFVFSAFQIFAFDFFKSFVFFFSKEIFQSAFSKDENLVSLKIFDFDICELRVNCQCKVRRKCPRGSSPGDKLDIGIILQRERDMNRWVRDLLVILLELKIRKNCIATVGPGHNLSASIYVSFVEEGLEDIPN